jgi:hypothetical protein
MGLTLAAIEADCRGFCNAQQITMLTPAIFLAAVNDAQRKWCDVVRYPRSVVDDIASLFIDAGKNYADVSAIDIVDIEAVYWKSISRRLMPLERPDTDLINSSEATSLSNTTDPAGYFWDQPRRRFYFYSGAGAYTAPEKEKIILYYTKLPAMLAAAGDIAEIPTVYCYDLKYYVAAYYYARVHDDANYKIMTAMWESACKRAIMRTEAGRRDHSKRFRDGNAFQRQRYIQGMRFGG